MDMVGPKVVWCKKRDTACLSVRELEKDINMNLPVARLFGMGICKSHVVEPCEMIRS